MIKCLHVPSMSGKLLLGMNFWLRFGIEVSMLNEKNSVFVVEENSDENVMNVSLDHKLTPEQSEKLKEVINEFPKSTEVKIGKTNVMKHEIETGNAKPVQRRPYLYSPATEKEIQEEIERWERMGVIAPSKSNWSNPLVIVPKPNGKKRVCLDARFLNKVTKKDQYPMKNINHLHARLPKGKFCSKVDLKDAFFQIELEEKSREKTAFVVPGRGLYEFVVMPFGLVNASKTMQAVMDRVLGHLHELYFKLFK